jgi:multidrug efflux pump subunit AcrA (membrane-fusion protein)
MSAPVFRLNSSSFRSVVACAILWLGCAALGLAQTSAKEVRHALKKVEPAQVVHLHGKSGGTLEGVQVKVGDVVKPEQTLGFLDYGRELHAYRVAKIRADNKGPVRSAEGELKKNHANLEDVRTRHRRRLASDSELLRSEADVQVAEGKLEQAKAQQEIYRLEVELADKALEDRFFKSPIAGTVMAVAKAPGEAVRSGDLVFTVADLTRLATTLLLPAEALDKLKAGGYLPVQLAGTNILRLGQIESLSPAENGLHAARIVFPNLAPNRPSEEADYEVRLPEGIKPQAAPAAEKAQ